jgi:hypothetical protein
MLDSMAHESVIDTETGRKFYLDTPDGLADGTPVTFLLNLHGGGSFGAWQRLYFPAHDYADVYSLVIATPTAATAKPARFWIAEADDAHLRNVTDLVIDRFGADRIAAFWLVGHSQGGFTCARLLHEGYFADRVDGWLSLSGGRIGPAQLVDGFGPPAAPGQPPWRLTPGQRARLRPEPPDTDLSFIYAAGELEIVALPETSPWAQRYEAADRIRLPDVVDIEPGQAYDRIRESYSTPSWGLAARPGTAQVYVYPQARDGRLIADIVRLDKGHTEGLEPNITRELVKMMVAAPGGKIGALRSIRPA